MSDYIKGESPPNIFGIKHAAWIWIGALLSVIALGALLVPRVSHASGPHKQPSLQSSTDPTCSTDYSYFDVEPVPCDPGLAEPPQVSTK